ncbi:protein translocase subunit SecDF [Spirosoma endophyticum]|uniref:Multifunctional fusion protein n=1 Tax=Spirosoma endophyticum TaxID=662367 RepID=A0A1I1PES9_9BACT|nr:protein translocase subunit SecDF [Spirosoma endophyticum]SFD04500.1 SecD/SecF fusion protein [Spirosoma endophyticum]
MQNRTGILILTGVLTVICLYFLSFTFVSRNFKNAAETYATNKQGQVDRNKKQHYLDSLWKEPVYLGSTLQEVTERELGLGLDLQGGMHVVLEVSPVDILRSLSGNNRDPKFNQALKQASEDQKTSNTSFVDLFASAFSKIAPDTKLATIFATSANRSKINFQSSDTEVRKLLNDEVNGATTRAFQIIQARVDKFGVANPNIQRLPGSGRIQIELPGVDNPERIRRLLTGAAKLEFTEVYRLNELAPAIEGMGAYLLREEAARKAALKTTTPTTGSATKGTSSLESQLAQGAKKDSTSKSDTAAAAAQGTALTQLFIPVGQDQLGVYLKDTARANAVLNATEVRSLFPTDAVFAWDRKTFKATDGKEILPLYFLKKAGGRAPLEGDVITDAANDYDDRGRPEVTMNMNPEGARKWKNLTAANVGRPVAILLDNLVYTAPNVQNEIPNGRSSISGNFTVEETKDMANVLKAGKLPAPTNIVEESVVGATLGSEAVSAGVLSSIIGILLVLAFVVFYYNRAGFIADIALLVNLFFLMGVMASLGAVLTMPGIAGIVLSIGMAVDANVLIFERIKEELALGKGFKQAVTDGFQNALSSIIDSNVTTFLTGIVLFIFGTGLILGFATTLIIGILTSLFAAIFITRILLEYYIRNGKTLTFSSSWAKNLFADSDFDFVSRRKLYYTVSSVIIGLGIISAIFRGFGLGVDFKGGRSYVIRFEKAVSTEDVRNSLETVLGGSPEVKTYGGTGIGANQVKVTTPYLVDDNSQGADKKAEATVYQGLSSIKGNPAKIESSQKVGPTIAYDLLTSALWSILLAVAVVFVYILIRFKKLAFGYGAVVAMFHDVLIILAIFSIFNGFLPFSLDVDQAFVGALLTIMGYSMNDTVVVFDRVREYLAENKGKKESIASIINNALNSTLSRTAVTGFSTILVLLVLFIFGGETIRGFSFAMLIGVVVGTYSSLFVATPIVVDALSRDQEKDAITPSIVAAEKKTGFDAIPADFTSAAPATPEEFTAKKEKKEKKPLIRPSQS